MTRAGDKLYADNDNVTPTRRGVFGSREFRRGLGGMMLALTIAAVVAFGFH